MDKIFEERSAIKTIAAIVRKNLKKVVVELKSLQPNEHTDDEKICIMFNKITRMIDSYELWENQPYDEYDDQCTAEYIDLEYDTDEIILIGELIIDQFMKNSKNNDSFKTTRILEEEFEHYIMLGKTVCIEHEKFIHKRYRREFDKIRYV